MGLSYGYASGFDGSGYGCGDGCGDGSGYGSGSGYGCGDAYGYGYGSGSGSDNGSGFGDGSSYGSGYGSGFGDGSGYESYVAPWLAGVPTPPGTRAGIWRANDDGRPANGGKNIGPAFVGQMQVVEGEPVLCHHGLHATIAPYGYKGTRWYLVALHEPIVSDGEKMVSSKRTILAEFGKP